jgi:hypothetical protein
MSAVPRKRKLNQGIGICHARPLKVDGAARRVIQAPKLEPRIMRYELTDYEWKAIKPFLPNKPRGVPRVNDRRVLNGMMHEQLARCNTTADSVGSSHARIRSR